MSLREAAGEGCSISFLSRIESGQRVPNPTIVDSLATRLGVAVEDLVGRAGRAGVDRLRLDAAELSARLGDDGAEAELEALRSLAAASGDRAAESRVLEALGLLALEQRRDQRAAELLSQALEVGVAVSPRERPGLYRALGRAYAGMGDLVRAIAVLGDAFDHVAADPTDPALMTSFGTYLANAYADAGRYGDAEYALSRIVSHERELAPGNALRLEWALARTYLEQGRLAIAECYIHRVMTRVEAADNQAQLGQAHLLLGRVLTDQGRLEEASAQLDASQDLLASVAAVEYVPLLIDRARIALAQGELDQAEEDLRQALSRTEATEPGHAGAIYGLLGEVALARGELDEARSLCQEALAQLAEPYAARHSHRIWTTLARVEESAGDLPAALAAYKARDAAGAPVSN